MGTPAYMAPEQARGDTAGAGSDLFSLGCVLYRLSAGRLPFEGGSILAVLSALASDTPRSLREIAPTVAPALDELVSRLLAKDPVARPGSAQAVVEETIRAIDAANRWRGVRVVEIPDDSHRRLATIAAAAEGRDGHRPTWRRRRIAWTIAAVAASAVMAFVMGRPARTEEFLRDSRPGPAVPTPAPTASAVDAKNGGANPAPGRSNEDHYLPKVAPAPMPGKDSETSSGRPAPATPSEARQTARRSDADAAIDDGPSGIPEPRRVMKHGEERPAPGAPASTTAIGSTPVMPGRHDWGTPIDPDGDCKFEFDRKGNGIRITVPGTPLHLPWSA